MSVSVSLSSRMGSEKVLWSWSVSLKNNKFGSAKSSSVTVGELVAVHSAISAIPQHLDIIFRSTDKKLVEIVGKPNPKYTKNPVIAQIYKMMKDRSGFVRALVVSPGSFVEEDKRAVKILETISGGGKKKSSGAGSPTRKSPNGMSSMLRPSTSKIKATVTRRPKKVAQPLTTGLEDWGDDIAVVGEKKGKPVLCDSCHAPISPLTNECLCSV